MLSSIEYNCLRRIYVALPMIIKLLTASGHTAAAVRVGCGRVPVHNCCIAADAARAVIGIGIIEWWSQGWRWGDDSREITDLWVLDSKICHIYWYGRNTNDWLGIVSRLSRDNTSSNHFAKLLLCPTSLQLFLGHAATANFIIATTLSTTDYPAAIWRPQRLPPLFFSHRSFLWYSSLLEPTTVL